MPSLEFLDVYLPELDPTRIRGFGLESPAPGSRSDAGRVNLTGWILGDPVLVVAIEVLADGASVGRVPVNHWRLDVAADYPGIVGAERSGFLDWVDLSGLDAEFRVQLVAVLADDTRIRLAHVRGRLEGSRRHRLGMVPGSSALEALPDWAPPFEPATTDPDPPPTLAPRRGTPSLDGPVAGEAVPRCSVIIPVHNKAALTRQCLDALLDRRPGDPAFEIVVVDDASTDETAHLLAAYRRRVRAVTLAENAGFAGACNAGAAAARGEYLVFLNNDTVPQPGWLAALTRHADLHLRAAVVGAKLLYPDDTVQHAGIVFGPERYPHHLYAGFPADHPAVNTSRRFRAVTAACCLVRRLPFEAVGGFDRAFINGWEDTDLCLRLGERGHEVHYCAESVVYHLESASRNVRADRERHNRELFATRWLPRIASDSVRYYVDDGLIGLTLQASTYPIRIEASPLLAVLGGGNREASAVLNERAGQVAVLQRTNVLLHQRLAEAGAREAELLARLGGAPSPPVAAPPRLLAKGRVHWPADGLTYRIVSLVLIVLGDDERVPALVARLLGQERGQGIDLVAIVDDPEGAAAIALREAKATIVAVEPEAHSPGALRNLAAAHAKGVVVVFVDSGAKPDDDWLARLLAPLDHDDATAVVVGAAPPDDDSEGAATPSLPIVLANDGRATPNLTEDERHRLLDLDVAGTAVRTDVVAEIPFPEAAADSDDRRWAERVLEAGYAIQWAPPPTPQPQPQSAA